MTSRQRLQWEDRSCRKRCSTEFATAAISGTSYESAENCSHVHHEDRDNGIIATFGAPDRGGPFPGVLALGGSDGGTPEYFLDLLVPEGFACLALQYWGTPDTQLSM